MWSLFPEEEQLRPLFSCVVYLFEELDHSVGMKLSRQMVLHSNQNISLKLSTLSVMIYISHLTEIGPVSITTDPKKFQQDLQELFVQVGIRMHDRIIILDLGPLDCSTLILAPAV